MSTQLARVRVAGFRSLRDVSLELHDKHVRGGQR